MEILKVFTLIIISAVPLVTAVPTLTIDPPNGNTGGTITLTCELSGCCSSSLFFDKDGNEVYNCALGGTTCDDSNAVADYSLVDWSQTDKGIVTITNANPSRDAGSWTCTVGGGGGTSSAVTLAVTDADCGTLTPPANGKDPTYSSGTTYQSVATYACETGYTLKGDATRTCQSDGTWSGSAPTCEINGPTPPATPNNNETTNSTSPVNSLPVSAIIAISTGCGLVVIIIIILVCCWKPILACCRKRKSKRNTDKGKRDKYLADGPGYDGPGYRDNHGFALENQEHAAKM